MTLGSTFQMGGYPKEFLARETAISISRFANTNDSLDVGASNWAAQDQAGADIAISTNSFCASLFSVKEATHAIQNL